MLSILANSTQSTNNWSVGCKFCRAVTFYKGYFISCSDILASTNTSLSSKSEKFQHLDKWKISGFGTSVSVICRYQHIRMNNNMIKLSLPCLTSSQARSEKDLIVKSRDYFFEAQSKFCGFRLVSQISVCIDHTQVVLDFDITFIPFLCSHLFIQTFNDINTIRESLTMFAYKFLKIVKWLIKWF